MIYRLETIRTQKQIRTSLERERMTETDFLLTIWGPMLQRLCSMKSLVRVKWCVQAFLYQIVLGTNHFHVLYSGESVNAVTTTKKQEVYQNKSNIIGFKIDIRLVYDGQEHQLDVSAGEIAKNTAAEKKVFMDQGKLLRESKDILDYLIQNASDENAHEKLSCFMIQIAGTSVVIASNSICVKRSIILNDVLVIGMCGEISSIHMAKPGKYVAVPQRKFIFPRNMLEVNKITNVLEGLMLLVVKYKVSALILYVL